MPSSEINYQLQQAIALAQSGQREEARQLLQQIVSFDPTVVAAWLWLATVAATQTERIYALQQVLNLDPNNEKARIALARLGVGETIDEAEMFPFDSDEGTRTQTDEQPQSLGGSDSPESQAFLSPSELIIIVTILIAVGMIVAVLIIRDVGSGDATPTPRINATPIPSPTIPTQTFTPVPTNTLLPPRTLPPSHTPTSTLTPSSTPTFTPTPEPLDGNIFGG